jgi:hypothetical protein
MAPKMPGPRIVGTTVIDVLLSATLFLLFLYYFPGDTPNHGLSARSWAWLTGVFTFVAGCLVVANERKNGYHFLIVSALCKLSATVCFVIMDMQDVSIFKMDYMLVYIGVLFGPLQWVSFAALVL